MTSESVSPEEVVLSIAKDPNGQWIILDRLIRSAAIASAISATAWALSQFRDGFRLNVGQVEVLVAFPGGMRLLLAADANDPRLARLPIESTAYKSVQGPQSAFAGSMEEYSAARSIIDPLHEAFIERAGRTTTGKARRGTPFARFHSPALVEFAAAKLASVAPARQVVETYPFVVGDTYTRQDVLKIVGLPDQRGGPWFTGYVSHGQDWFIFCGIGTGGRTGHDYGNHFIGDQLAWTAKGPSRLHQSAIRDLLNPAGEVYVFYREADRDPFTFGGLGSPVEVRDTSPVQVVWALRSPDGLSPPEVLPEEIDPSQETVPEGASRTVTVNVYERDPNARRRCIERWGTRCSVCDFDFAATYGELGLGFIHVHHLKPLGEVRAEYALNPITDLRPVCANCHAMLHRRQPALQIETLRDLLSRHRETPKAGQSE